MGLTYHHLGDEEVRQQMAALWRAEGAELARSYPRDKWPYGKLLSDEGWEAYGKIMPTALLEFDDTWLESQMASGQYWLEKLPRRKPKGGVTLVEYDKADAIRRLAVGEFNTAYVRALATVLLGRGATRCMVYRAGPAVEQRLAYCTGLEGSELPLQQVLNAHRAYFPERRPSAQPIPSGPHCHHSIRAVASLD